jgi:hypothetical protein
MELKFLTPSVEAMNSGGLRGTLPSTNTDAGDKTPN